MEVSLTMDNDSGYVSHNQESNLDSSSELSDKPKFFTSHELYLSEDALLEKPKVKNNFKEVGEFGSFDSVINSSQDSVKTEFSGFEDSDRSDISIIVSEVKPITWKSTEWKEDQQMNKKNDGSVTENLNSPRESCSAGNKTSMLKPTLLSCNSNSVYKVLANVTNTYDHNPNQVMPKNVFTDSDKENIHPSETPKKQYENRLTSDVSPDLFSEDEDSLNSMPLKQKCVTKKYKENYCIKDIKLLRKVQSCLSGVHPPPSLTTVQMSVNEMLNKIKENEDLFCTTCDDQQKKEEKSLLISDQPEAIYNKWPEVLKARYHGLHYNRHRISEDFEHLCSRYAERYVGVETQSSCTVFEINPSSSQKRKFSKPRWTAKSPGRRLSHLARRRITFTSSNLHSSASSSILGSRARQILVDAKKLNISNRKSPRKSPRKTPSKSPFKCKRTTPSSSAKKKLAMRFRQMSGEFESAPSCSSDHSVLSFKRALFNSPKHEKKLCASGGLLEKKSTKRALFSSPSKHSSQHKSPFKVDDRKRKRSDLDENPSKFPRSMSCDIKPTQAESKLVMNRTLSEVSMSRPNMPRNEELSDQHKKKLQWAVYESLRLQNITPTHPQYKIFASVLARVTRRFLPSLRIEGRTTEKMFRIARYHSYAVVKGKTVDEIVNEYMKNKIKSQKPQGYVKIEEFNILKSDLNSDNKERILQDKANIIESIEKRREYVGTNSKFLNENRIDRIKKVISFEETSKDN